MAEITHNLHPIQIKAAALNEVFLTLSYNVVKLIPNNEKVFQHSLSPLSTATSQVS